MNADVSSDTLGFALSDDARKTDEIPSWAGLPSIALENIYSYLDNEDRRSMSLVCRNWNSEYGSTPSLWRKRKVKFLIPEEDSNLEVYPEVQFATKYGPFFRHVQIEWPSDVGRRHPTELAWNQIKLFLEALATHSQLETISLIHLRKYYRYDGLKSVSDDDTIGDDVRRTLTNFFSSQRELKSIEFRKPAFSEREAAEILRVIFCDSSSKSIQNVRLDAFTAEEAGTAGNVGNEEASVHFESFLKIKTLQLHYSHFFEDMMTTFYERAAQNSDYSRRTEGNNLESMEILCEASTGLGYRGIPPKCWQLLTETCPSLSIHLTFRIEDFVENGIDLFAVPHMPLGVLEIACRESRVRNRHRLPESKIRHIFRHLWSHVEYLEDLRIDWRQNNKSIARHLIRFLPTCEKLKTFQLNVDDPIKSLDRVLSWCLENRPPSLRNVSITIRNVICMREAEFYSEMADAFGPPLQMQGVELRLIVEETPQLLRLLDYDEIKLVPEQIRLCG